MSLARAHDDSHPKHDVLSPRREVRREDGQQSAPWAAAGVAGLLSRFSPAMVSRLQGSVGSRAISGALSTGGLAVQRAAEEEEEEELSTVDEDAAQMTEKGSEQHAGPSAPAGTTTKAEEKKELEAGKDSRAARGLKRVHVAQKLKSPAASLAGAQEVLQGVYGRTKKIVPGTIVVLKDQTALNAKYDEFAIAEGAKRPDGSDWKPGDTARFDAEAGVRMYGFARKGTIYVTGETSLEGTMHEMLHVNTSANFGPKVGETFNEGATEYLTQKAVRSAGMTVSGDTGYAVQVELTKLLVDLVGEATLIKAYFDNVEELVRAYLSKGSKTWDDLYQAAEALDTDGVKEALKPRGASR